MVQKSNRKTKYTTPSEWSKNLTEKLNIPQQKNVGMVQKSNQNIPHRRNGPKI